MRRIPFGRPARHGPTGAGLLIGVGLRTGHGTGGAGSAQEWSRPRLIAILATAVTVAVVLLTGLGYAVYLAVDGVGDAGAGPGPATGVDTGVDGGSPVAQGSAHRDHIAAAPMLAVAPDAALPDSGLGSGLDPGLDTGVDPGVDTSADPGARSIAIPPGSATTPGPGLVATGFPHTPQGAIGQLAQIDTTVLDSMSLQTAGDVYDDWALNGGVGPDGWWITQGVQGFLSNAGMGQVMATSTTVTTTPAAALVKGTDGPDWATVCVLMEVAATYRSDGQVALGHCERMQWVNPVDDPADHPTADDPAAHAPGTTTPNRGDTSAGGRWMIAPGTPPALAPSTWPGTDLADSAGWRTWTTDTDQGTDTGTDMGTAGTGPAIQMDSWSPTLSGGTDDIGADETSGGTATVGWSAHLTAAHSPTRVTPPTSTSAVTEPRQPAGIDIPIPNPLADLGSIIAKAAADAWTAAMLTVWMSSLYAFGIVMAFSEAFLTPDLAGDGPGQDIYAYLLWLALSLVVILTAIQLGAAAFKREGKGLARALVGAGQFVVVCATWFGYCVTIVAACGELTQALMKGLLHVNDWGSWDPMAGVHTEDIADATVATVLAFLGVFLWLAVIGHVLVYLARAAGLLLLTATGPLAAAGLVSDFTRAWFWKSLRWFHAAAFTPVLMVMVLGVGVQMASGVAKDLADGTQRAIGTALPSVMLILVSIAAPMALFKLLAFVDPGTPSGASFRQGMAVHGGLSGLLTGGSATSGAGGAGGAGAAASSADANGRSGGEQGAEEATSSRFNGAAAKAGGTMPGIGQAISAGAGLLMGAGAQATSLMADQSNQAGVGHATYGPDFGGGRGQSRSGPGGHPIHDPEENDDVGGGDGESGGGGGGGGDQSRTSGGFGEGPAGGSTGGDTAPLPPSPTPPVPTPPAPPATTPAAGGGPAHGGPGGGSGGRPGGAGAPPGPGGAPPGAAGGAGAGGAAAGGAAVA